MSWASDNPELYDEICIRGVAEKLSNRHSPYAVPYEDAASIAETIYNECPEAFKHLVTWASKEIHSREADHFSGLLDERVE